MRNKIAHFGAECSGIQINVEDNKPFKYMTFLSQRVDNEFEEWNENHYKDWIQSLKIKKMRN